MSATLSTAPVNTNGTQPGLFSDAARSMGTQFLAALSPLSRFKKDADALLAAKPAIDRGRTNHFGPDGESAMGFYLEGGTFDTMHDASAFLQTDFSGVKVFGAAISIALDAINHIMARCPDAESESLRKEALDYLKSLDPRFKPSFFVDVVSQAAKVHATYKSLESEVTFLQGRWNVARVALYGKRPVGKGVVDNRPGLTYAKYFEYCTSQGESTVAVVDEKVNDTAESLAAAF